MIFPAHFHNYLFCKSRHQLCDSDLIEADATALFNVQAHILGATISLIWQIFSVIMLSINSAGHASIYEILANESHPY